MTDIINRTTLLFDQLCDILEWSRSLSAVKIRENESQSYYHIGETFFELRDKVEKLLRNENTAFLAGAIIAQYWSKYFPAIVIPAEEILNGDTKKIDQIKAFIEALKDDPAQREWVDLSEKIKDIAEKSGFKISHPKFNDLAAISHIVYDAITANSLWMSNSIPYCFQAGKKSTNKPILLNEIGIFSSESEAYHAFKSLPIDSFIAFYGVKQKYGQTDDTFDEWLNGGTERQRNVMRNEKISLEEYKNTYDDYSRSLSVMIRNGDNIYTISPPIRCGTYGDSAYSKKFDSYGNRTSYAPTQIFYENIPYASESSTALAPYNNRNHWKLSDIIDEEQQIWIPIFFTKTAEKFFAGNPVEGKSVYLPEEVCITHCVENGIVPVSTPAVIHNTYNIPEPEEVFTVDEKATSRIRGTFMGSENRTIFAAGANLCKEFGITSENIKDVPLKHNVFTDEETAMKNIRNNVIAAYCLKIGEKCEEIWESQKKETFKWYHEQIEKRFDIIRNKALLGEYSFASTRIHNRQILNEDGTPKMENKNSWSSELKPVLETTDIDEGKRVWIYEGRSYEKRYWEPNTLIGKHPPVVMLINPKTPQDLSELLDIPVEKLPFILKYHNVLKFFRRQSLKKHMVFYEEQITVSIRYIFGKRDYKKALEEAEKNKRET